MSLGTLPCCQSKRATRRAIVASRLAPPTSASHAKKSGLHYALQAGLAAELASIDQIGGTG